MNLKDYVKELIQEVNTFQIVETIEVNTTVTFGKKGEKTYHYRLFDKNDKRISHFEFKEPKTNGEIKAHYVNLYANPKYGGMLDD